MSPMEDDPTLWEAAMRTFKELYLWILNPPALLLPAVAGAFVGLLREEKRKRTKGQWISRLFMSALVGFWLTPLVSHTLSWPNDISQAVAFFLGLCGQDLVDVLQYRIQRKIGGKKKDEGECE